MVLITIHFASAITIQDNFDDGTINASMWTGTGITESSNRARISAHLDYLAFNVSGQANIDSDVNMTVNVSLNLMVVHFSLGGIGRRVPMRVSFLVLAVAVVVLIAR